MSAIDAGEPSPSAKAAEEVATRFDEWQIAYGILKARFDSFGPYDVLCLVEYLKSGETGDE